MKKLFAIIMAIVFTVCGSVFLLSACGNKGDTDNGSGVVTPGGDTPGGDTSGGDTSGGDTSGGDTSGGIWTPPVKQ